MPKTYGISWLDNDTVAAWIFFTPALILLGIFIVWPIAYLFYQTEYIRQESEFSWVFCTTGG